MFAFHKPRVYRSTEGCCICRAKSSSSRFTDSKKYEEDSMKCFDLKQPRHGEICNACVLLVKRFKRLPLGSNRHWGHVVDARAGPGMKSLTKFKKLKDDDCTHASTKSLISEKFNKIFKKKKKLNKDSKNDRKEGGGKRNKSNFSSSSTWYTQSLPPTPDSLDSDYEDARVDAGMPPMVQYQTMTRSSSYRVRSKPKVLRNGNNDSGGGGGGGSGRSSNSNKIAKRGLGSNRRKFLPPQKNRNTSLDNLPFFDLDEWTSILSCCGLLYENKQLNAIILDIENYKPCKEHVTSTLAQKALKPSASRQQFKLNSQLTTTASTVSAAAIVKANNTTYPVISNLNSNPTPVLKKHHLFFKRQSECFPHGDAMTINNNSLTPPPAASSPMKIATIATVSVTTQTANPKTDFSRNCKISSSKIATTKTSIINTHKNDVVLLSPENSEISSQQCAQYAAPIISNGSSNHVTKTGNSTINNNNSKSNSSFLHKIKSDAGKIVRNSLDKFNSLKIKSEMINEMKQQNLIKTLDKPYGLNKVLVPVSSNNYNSNGVLLPSKSLSQSTSVIRNVVVNQTMTTKFSDNSSDSGFDENTQDRKSVSPLQDDADRRISTPPVQTMFVPNGVQIPETELIRGGSEMSQNILEARKRQQQQQVASQQAKQLLQQNRGLINTSNKMCQPTQTTSGGSLKIRQQYLIGSHPHYHHQQYLADVGTSITATSSSINSTSATQNLVAISPHLNPNSLSSSLENSNKKISTTHALTAATCSTKSNNNNNVSSLNQKIILVKTTNHNNNPLKYV